MHGGGDPAKALSRPVVELVLYLPQVDVSDPAECGLLREILLIMAVPTTPDGIAKEILAPLLDPTKLPR